MLTAAQKEALAKANELLENAGLDPVSLSTTPQDPLIRPPPTDSSNALLSVPIHSWQQRPSPARLFSAEEINSKRHIVNRQCKVDFIAEHRSGAIVEYPACAPQAGQIIAHRFAVDPDNFFHPKFNIQYSIGGTHGSEPNVLCGSLLCDSQGQPVYCNKFKAGCKGLKICDQYSPTYRRPPAITSHETVFMKTLSFFAAVMNTRCGLACESDVDIDYAFDRETPFGAEDEAPPIRKNCDGQLVLSYDRFNHPRLQCEFRGTDEFSHLILRNLQDFDMCYLTALLQNQHDVILELEMQAKAEGFGPLAPCSFTASPSEQKQECPHLHRNREGKLSRGSLRNSSDCPVHFSVYTPHDLLQCPFIVILVREVHNHEDPFPVKSPPPISELFKSLLLELDWKLADATPRKIMLDSGFINSLRRQLGWTQLADPCLSDLHPSLGNLDHVRRFITDLRKKYFPDGTDFEGARHLADYHKTLPLDEQYLRCAEKHQIENNKVFELVICMSRAMSGHLMNAEHISIDTSFKRVHGRWQEFEIETWEPSHMKSIVGARAFTTSQLARAHFILFRRIFEIAEADTGVPVRFYHIHGSGFRTWIADAHKGQALGAGMFCQKLCENLTTNCLIETSRRLKDLSAYDHLRRFLRLCTIHFKRKIRELRNSLSDDVASAMYSLISSQPLADFNGTLEIIRNGGSKAEAWLKDKIDAKFVIPAIYRPHSLITLEHWLASPPTTNGNEQSHRSINRDGIALTLLGGICRALQYDFRLMASLLLHVMHGIYARDQRATDYRRSQTSVTRQIAVQRRVHDKKPSTKGKKKQPIPQAEPQHNSSSTMPPTVVPQCVVPATRYHPYFLQPQSSRQASSAEPGPSSLSFNTTTPADTYSQAVPSHLSSIFDPYMNFYSSQL